MRAWQAELKQYEANRKKAVPCERPEAVYKPPYSLQNPITHQFYDSQVQKIVEEQQRKFEVARQNIARDKQLKLQGSFNFIDDRDAYSKIRPQDRKYSSHYEFTQPHVVDSGFVPSKTSKRTIPQNSSDGVRSTFINMVDPTLPLITKKSNEPYSNRKRSYAQKYDDVTRFPLGYVGVE